MKFTTTLLLATTLVSSAYAMKEEGDKKRRPPREAIVACESKDEGASCSFSGKRGDVSGTCVKKESSKPAACKPTRE